MGKSNRMKFVARVPSLAEQIGKEDPIAMAKLEAPWNGWTYYVCGFDGSDTCYGYVRRGMRGPSGMSCFSLARVLGLRGPKDEIVECDEEFRPTRVSDINLGWERCKE